MYYYFTRLGVDTYNKMYMFTRLLYILILSEYGNKCKKILYTHIYIYIIFNLIRSHIRFYSNIIFNRSIRRKNLPRPFTFRNIYVIYNIVYIYSCVYEEEIYGEEGKRMYRTICYNIIYLLK